MLERVVAGLAAVAPRYDDPMRLAALTSAGIQRHFPESRNTRLYSLQLKLRQRDFALHLTVVGMRGGQRLQ